MDIISAPNLTTLQQEIKKSSKEALIVVPLLFMGLGTLLWVPLSLALGRRPVFLFVALLMLFAALGTGYATTYEQLLACLCVIGFGDGFSMTSVRCLCTRQST